jgi:hypothetical protein
MLHIWKEFLIFTKQIQGQHDELLRVINMRTSHTEAFSKLYHTADFVTERYSIHQNMDNKEETLMYQALKHDQANDEAKNFIVEIGY